MNASGEPPVVTGEVIGGKYRVGDVIGSGGMGVVMAGTHITLGQPVAIKFMHTDAGAGALSRFQREAAVVVQMKSEHVCRVLDQGVIATGAMYIVMERLEGKDLGELVHGHGPIPLSGAVEYIVQACEPLAEAHLRGIVHRDLKPSNLFLTQRVDGTPCIKLLDFGISKVRDAEAPLTATGALLGSVHFMSPEQLDNAKAVDLRSDIWSLGATLFELLTGIGPFEADSLAEIAIKITYDPPMDLASVSPSLAAVAPVVRRCLEKDPADRFHSVADLVAALARFAPVRSSTYIDRIVGMHHRTDRTVALPSRNDPAAVAATELGPTATDVAPVRARPTLRDTVDETSVNHAPTVVAAAPAKKTARRVVMGVLGATALLGAGLWLGRSSSARDSPAEDEAQPKTKKKRKAKKKPAPSPEPKPIEAPEDIRPTWLEAKDIIAQLKRATEGQAKVVTAVRFFRSRAEIVLADEQTRTSLEYVWLKGVLLPPTDAHKSYTPKELKDASVRLDDLDPAVVVALEGRVPLPIERIMLTVGGNGGIWTAWHSLSTHSRFRVDGTELHQQHRR